MMESLRNKLRTCLQKDSYKFTMFRRKRFRKRPIISEPTFTNPTLLTGEKWKNVILSRPPTIHEEIPIRPPRTKKRQPNKISFNVSSIADTNDLNETNDSLFNSSFDPRSMQTDGNSAVVDNHQQLLSNNKGEESSGSSGRLKDESISQLDPWISDGNNSIIDYDEPDSDARSSNRFVDSVGYFSGNNRITSTLPSRMELLSRTNVFEKIDSCTVVNSQSSRILVHCCLQYSLSVSFHLYFLKDFAPDNRHYYDIKSTNYDIDALPMEYLTISDKSYPINVGRKCKKAKKKFISGKKTFGTLNRFMRNVKTKLCKVDKDVLSKTSAQQPREDNTGRRFSRKSLDSISITGSLLHFAAVIGD